MKAIFTLILLLLINCSFYAQVKIGDNPSLIDLNSILELESIDKALVISRMSDTQMLAIQPLKGALVYNTTENCVFVYDGTLWKSLCNNGTGTGTDTGTSIKVTTSNAAPTDNGLADFWINPDLNNSTSIWDGSNWIALDNNPIKGNGTPETNVTNSIAGDLYIDSTTGDIYTYDGSNWIPAKTQLTADNGLTMDTTNNIQLGGVLIKPTIIETSAAFTLGITGLEDGDLTTDAIVTVNPITGLLKKVTTTSLLREEVTPITAIDGQVQFTPNIVITDEKKVNVYRNGVRIDFTVVNSTTIEIEPEATCYSGDKIRIVQFY
ncbi:hypothetical protein PG913_07920 [Tenacibaculum pacificus]|uniref:hypothetical protein n=1 Tax=Tenacibaculum pacificus TaxID=3018314 RepID=UPI0022F3C146|nr:hypothetical protein [Tenacibaculum pacificus]WBX72832.1 hypothetical protein PG913_07920 [Tenacibaculum pacificus]